MLKLFLVSTDGDDEERELKKKFLKGTARRTPQPFKERPRSGLNQRRGSNGEFVLLV